VSKFNPLHPAPCLYFKHGAYWLVKRGKWERIGTTLEEAMAEYGRRVQSAKEGKLPELIEKTYGHHIKVAKLAENTKDQYRRATDVLKRKFARFDRPDQVKAKHVAKIKTDGAETPNMTNRIVSLLRTMFGYWLEWQLAEHNPCVGVRRFQEAKRERLITMEEWWSIYDQAGPRLRVIMKLALLTGQRIGDVLTIRRNQLTDGGIEFRQQKTGAKLVVKWSPDLRIAVDEALAMHRGVPALTLFLGRKGKPPNYRSVLLQWHAACKAAGVQDAKPNDQRAQSLTGAEEQGRDPTALAGHASEAMTKRYLRGRKAKQVDGPILRQALDVGQKAE
jgi:integrase